MKKTYTKKGYVLLLAVMLSFVLMASSVGLYAMVRYFVLETRIKEVEYIKGYYAAIAGLRYAWILLKDPEDYCGFNTLDHDGETRTVIGTELGGNFFTNIGTTSQKLTITITEWNSLVTDPTWTNGNYRVTVRYSY